MNFMYKNIVVVLQGKQSDEFPASYAVDLAQTYQATITLLRVITIMGDGPKTLGKQFQTEIGSSGWRKKQNAIQDLSKMQKSLLSMGLPIETAIVVGERSQADEIVSFAEQGGFDLIVMVSDGHSWLKCMLSDCPADGVRRKARIPVLFVNDGKKRKDAASKPGENSNSIMAMFGEPCI
jgi:nucleotide-binding universal stress UspA family protein